MKEIKIILIATIITVLLLVSCAFAIPVHAEELPEFYPRLTVVFEIEMVGNCSVVYCIDKSQNIWSFYDDEGTWAKGDIANLLMWHIGEREEEDEIIEVYWEGYTENLEMFFQVMGWR